MNVDSSVVDAADIEWRHGETDGITFRGQILLSGDDGGPEAFRFRFDPCLAVYAHMHMVSQFQMLARRHHGPAEADDEAAPDRSALHGPCAAVRSVLGRWRS